MRSTLTPTFSAAKMKKMATIMTDAITIMIHVVQKHAEDRSEANFYDLFQALTLDVIGNFVRILCIIAYPSMCIFMDLYVRTCLKLIDIGSFLISVTNCK